MKYFKIKAECDDCKSKFPLQLKDSNQTVKEAIIEKFGKLAILCDNCLK
ncbi:MAG: hypothetical protein KJ674_01430 [Nanoarchaeota archaeon]|nr:hypothetical protein [Nanoarchaeota archaeon]